MANFPIDFGSSFNFLFSTTQQLDRNDLTFDELLKESAGWPLIEELQFAMRFAGDYLKFSDFAMGTRTDHVVDYWCHWLDQWILGKCQLIDAGIPIKHLIDLKTQLNTLKTLYQLIQRSPGDSGTIAGQLLDQIQANLKKNNYVYVPLGWRGGTQNQGHSLPLRIDYNHEKKEVYLHFLNLGGGVHYHPQLEWNENYLRYHFRSFRLTYRTEDFFGTTGRELFSKMMTLCNVACLGYENGYSATDIYEPFYMMGTPSDTFTDSPFLRSRKPQKGPRCGDEAVELVIRDFLLDRGIDHRRISRFFANENLDSMLSYYHRANELSTKETWTFYKRGLQRFAKSYLKKNRKVFREDWIRTSLSDEELKQWCPLIDFLTATAIEGEKKCKKFLPLPLEIKITSVDCHFELFKYVNLAGTTVNPNWKLGVEAPDTPQPSLQFPQPTHFRRWIGTIRDYLITLANKAASLRSRGFVFSIEL